MSDFDFRPPTGALRLSDALFDHMMAFKAQCAAQMPGADLVLAITWCESWMSRDPGATEWVEHGPCFVLGIGPREADDGTTVVRGEPMTISMPREVWLDARERVFDLEPDRKLVWR